MKFRLRVEGREEIKQTFRVLPKEIRRAARRTVRQVTNELHRELGGKIPRTAGVSVVGYRRVRAKKRTPKGRQVGSRGVVWLGTNQIEARFAGRMRDSETFGGAFAGKYFFENAFVAKFDSGYVGIFKRSESGKTRHGKAELEKQYINLPKSHEDAAKAAQEARPRMRELLQENLELERQKRRKRK